MDDGVRLNTSPFTPDGTAVPNDWPATVFVRGLADSMAAAVAMSESSP